MSLSKARYVGLDLDAWPVRNRSTGAGPSIGARGGTTRQMASSFTTCHCSLRKSALRAFCKFVSPAQGFDGDTPEHQKMLLRCITRLPRCPVRLKRLTYVLPRARSSLPQGIHQSSQQSLCICPFLGAEVAPEMLPAALLQDLDTPHSRPNLNLQSLPDGALRQLLHDCPCDHAPMHL